MATPKRRKRHATMGLFITSERRGVTEFHKAYSPGEAAKVATKLARAGWAVKVTGRDWAHPQVKMRCAPRSVSGRTVATCSMTPVFKRLLKS